MPEPHGSKEPAGRAPGYAFETLDRASVLKRVALFARLQPAELEFIAARTRLAEYRRGDVIYRAGDPPDALYIIVSGRITVSAGRGEEGPGRVLATLRDGDCFGEISLLTQEPHSVSVTVKNDALLLRLDHDGFAAVVEHLPTIGIHLSQVLSRRLRATGREGEHIRESHIMSFYSASPGVGKTTFAVNLAVSLAVETKRRTVLVDLSPQGQEVGTILKLPPAGRPVDLAGEALVDWASVQPRLQASAPGVEVLSVPAQHLEGADPRAVVALLSALTEGFDYILVDLPVSLNDGLRKALSQADAVYLITGSSREELLGTRAVLDQLKGDLPDAQHRVRVLLSKIEREDKLSLVRKEHLLQFNLHGSLPNTPVIRSYAELKGTPFVIGSPQAAYSKAVRYLAREIGGVLVGLVLSSGAVAALAHVGVIKVLEREHIPIDVVCGSSMGAVVAAGWASGKDGRALEQVALSLRGDWRTMWLLMDPALPLLGFVRGHKVLRFLDRLFSHKTFADTWLPLRVTTVNLSKREGCVIQEGSLAEAVRDSVSIPGVFQPRLHDGDVFVDGGILQPVPVAPLRRLGVQKIIAVNVLSSKEDILESRLRVRETRARFQRMLTQRPIWERLVLRLRAALGRIVLPVIFDVIVNSMQTMEYEIAELACREADVVIRPTDGRAGWMEFGRAARVIRRGEEEAEKMLPAIRRLLQE